jgi:hypothetical protein
MRMLVNGISSHDKKYGGVGWGGVGWGKCVTWISFEDRDPKKDFRKDSPGSFLLGCYRLRSTGSVPTREWHTQSVTRARNVLDRY